MRLHYLQHVPFEGPAMIEDWAKDRGHSLECTRWFESDSVPTIEDVDGLIVMGGPMGVNDVDKYPWLQQEADYIWQFSQTGKPLLGICLGAQIIAHVLGAAVTRNAHKEIGWFPLQVNSATSATALASVLVDNLPVFHWHGDTFALPEGAVHLASSVACANQAFIINNRIIGLQFHLEATEAWAERLIKHCRDELDNSTYVQTAEQMLAFPERFIDANRVMEKLLDRWSLSDMAR